MDFNWIVSQIGARRHYGIPRGFQNHGKLRLLYTEAWCRFARSLMRRGPSPVRALAARFHPDIPSAKVVSFNVATVYDTLFRTPKNPDLSAQYLDYLRIGQWYDDKVTAHLSRQSLSPQFDAFYSFNTGALKTIEMLKARGVFTVVNQIDPARVEEELVHRESEKWTGWERVPGRVPEPYWQRLSAEWNAADLVLVNSQWSKSALMQQGVPESKLAVVPISFEPHRTHVPNRKNLDGPLTVLWIGGVMLRKGIQYLVEAAKKLNGQANVRFVIGGPILISDDAVKSAPPNMTFLGRVHRDATEEMYRQADVFVLPTLSDGFAVTQVEAMAQGLPVITTPNCGEVVTHGIDGLIVPAFDADALAAAVAEIDADRPRLREMSMKALEKSVQFDLAQQTRRINAVATAHRDATTTPKNFAVAK